MHLIHAIAECADCGKYWDSKNALAVAAIHHKKTGHEVRVEVGYVHRYARSASKENADG